MSTKKISIKKFNEGVKEITQKVHALAELTDGLSKTDKGSIGLLFAYYQPEYEDSGIIQKIGHPVVLKGIVADAQERTINPLQSRDEEWRIK